MCQPFFGDFFVDFLTVSMKVVFECFFTSALLTKLPSIALLFTFLVVFFAIVVCLSKGWRLI
jgi:hypothetical protein